MAATTDTALPKAGEVFTFHGLADEPSDARSITIRNVSLTGKVSFAISLPGEDARGLHDAPLTEVVAMIAHGIWRRAGEPDTGAPAGLTVTREQLETWVGHALTDADVRRIGECLPHSSVPDALETIAHEALDLTDPDETD